VTVLSSAVEEAIIKSAKTILMLMKEEADVMLINEFQTDILTINRLQNILEQQTQV